MPTEPWPTDLRWLERNKHNAKMIQKLQHEDGLHNHLVRRGQTLCKYCMITN